MIQANCRLAAAHTLACSSRMQAQKEGSCARASDKRPARVLESEPVLGCMRARRLCTRYSAGRSRLSAARACRPRTMRSSRTAGRPTPTRAPALAPSSSACAACTATSATASPRCSSRMRSRRPRTAAMNRLPPAQRLCLLRMAMAMPVRAPDAGCRLDAELLATCLQGMLDEPETVPRWLLHRYLLTSSGSRLWCLYSVVRPCTSSMEFVLAHPRPSIVMKPSCTMLAVARYPSTASADARSSLFWFIWMHPACNCTHSE